MSEPSRPAIGPYLIVARVGAGGMGEVFKAWDPRLERDVAIKLLHPETALDPDRQRRLLAEGRAASALNHPNILRVYDVDVEGSSYYLVSEWLEGKSLRDEISKGPLPTRRLLELAVQIADGLAAAHAIGIVHRDIKPDNVMLAKDGTARIVDFGLARPDPQISSVSTAVGHAATVSLEGGLSGTPAYMSPEQARGTAGDFRTDQFSFGALLYELATGTFAFRRDSVADTLSAVLHEEPRPIQELNPRIPAALRWIVEQCLAKDASERYSATDDLARELRRVRDRLLEALADPKLLDGPVAARHRWAIPAALAAAALLAGSLVTGLMLAEPEPAVMTFLPVASASAYEGEPAWSTDGQSLAYVADVDGVLQVFAKRLGDPVSRQVTSGRFDAQHPFWSHNGQLIYFISPAGEREALWSVGVAGGRPEVVLENVTRAAIDRQGTRLALFREDEETYLRRTLWWSSPPGAAPTKEVRAPFDRVRATDGRLAFSSDGQLLVWVNSVTTNGVIADSDFYVLPPGGGEPLKAFADITSATSISGFGWLADNRHAMLSLPDQRLGSRHLWIADTKSDRTRQVTSTHTNETDAAVSPDGRRVAYASDEVDFDLALISADGQTRRSMLATARNEFSPVWSRAGDQFAFVTDRSGALEIWTRSRDAQWERPIVTESDFGSSVTMTLGALAFSPDGRTLAYQRSADGGFEIWLSPTTGGTPIRLLPSNFPRPYQDAPTWSPDGGWIAFAQDIERDGSRSVLMKLRVGTSEPVELADNLGMFSQNAWSPDGRWIAFQTPAGLMRVAAAGGKPELIAADSMFGYTWTADSRRLYALMASEASGHFALVEIDADTGSMRTLNPDLGSIPIANQPIRGFSFTREHGFLTSLASARADIWLLSGFAQPRGWFDRLLRRGR